MIKQVLKQARKDTLFHMIKQVLKQDRSVSM